MVVLAPDMADVAAEVGARAAAGDDRVPGAAARHRPRPDGRPRPSAAVGRRPGALRRHPAADAADLDPAAGGQARRRRRGRGARHAPARSGGVRPAWRSPAASWRRSSRSAMPTTRSSGTACATPGSWRSMPPGSGRCWMPWSCRTPKNEYYLTDVVEHARARGWPCVAVEMPWLEALGVNSQAQLAEAEAVLQDRLRQAAMAAGRDADRPGNGVSGQPIPSSDEDVEIGPYVVFGPGVRVARGARILPFCHLEGVTHRRRARRSGRSPGSARTPRSAPAPRSAISSRSRTRRSSRAPRPIICPTSATPGSAPRPTSAPAPSPATTTALPSTGPTSAPAPSSAPTPRWSRR